MATTVDLDRNPYALNTIMEFDHVIYVDNDGTVSDGLPELYAPELYVDEDGNDIFEAGDDGWTLMDGYSGQYGYSGPVMHPSEFIGGRLAEDILERPGWYVAIVAETLGDDETEPAGWAVARIDAE
jgi:hypothetical protein